MSDFLHNRDWVPWSGHVRQEKLEPHDERHGYHKSSVVERKALRAVCVFAASNGRLLQRLPGLASSGRRMKMIGETGGRLNLAPPPIAPFMVLLAGPSKRFITTVDRVEGRKAVGSRAGAGKNLDRLHASGDNVGY
jgi:hypothetical protein